MFSEESCSKLRFSMEDLAKKEKILGAVLILELEIEDSFINSHNCVLAMSGYTTCSLYAVSTD